MLQHELNLNAECMYLIALLTTTMHVWTAESSGRDSAAGPLRALRVRILLGAGMHVSIECCALSVAVFDVAESTESVTVFIPALTVLFIWA